MKYLKTYLEVIKVPIEIGDTVKGGRFKNKKMIVKKIGKNIKGDITINDKPLLKYRIVKEGIFSEKFKKDIEIYLSHLTDNGFHIEMGSDYIKITKKIKGVEKTFKWDDIEEEVSRLLYYISNEMPIKYIYSDIQKSEAVTKIVPGSGSIVYTAPASHEKILHTVGGIIRGDISKSPLMKSADISYFKIGYRIGNNSFREELNNI